MSRNRLALVSSYWAAAFALVAGVAAHGIDSAQAASMTIVALGTSNTFGKGVARGETYPARLQAMLKAKGIDARVVNAGVNGDTSKGMLARVNAAVPNGTRLVLVETFPGNEAKRGVTDTSSNLAAITSRLQARGINSIDVSGTVTSIVTTPGGAHQADGHLSGPGYEAVASSVLPQVMSAIGR